MLKHVKWVITSLKWKLELKITIINVIMFPAMLDPDKLVNEHVKTLSPISDGRK